MESLLVIVAVVIVVLAVLALLPLAFILPAIRRRRRK